MYEHGYCPFRIEVADFQAGCKLRIGEQSLCYSQDAQPLIKNPDQNSYYCPLLKFSIPEGVYEEISSLVDYILTIQDKENTSINLWPLVSGISRTKFKSSTMRGLEMVKLSKKVRDHLEEIIYELH